MAEDLTKNTDENALALEMTCEEILGNEDALLAR